MLINKFQTYSYLNVIWDREMRVSAELFYMIVKQSAIYLAVFITRYTM